MSIGLFRFKQEGCVDWDTFGFEASLDPLNESDLSKMAT